MKKILFIFLLINITFAQWGEWSNWNANQCYVTNFGAIANDAIQDRSAIQDAINSNCNHIIIGSTLADTFLLDQPLNLKSDMTLELNGVLKIMNADSGILTGNISIGDSTFKTSSINASKLAIGEWVGVCDNNSVYNYAAYWAWSGKILSITDSTIKLNGPANYNYLTSADARFSNVNNAILCENKENVTIEGTGKILGNRNHHMQLHPIYALGIDEQQKAGCGITVWQSDNITIKDITVRDCLLHNICITGDGTTQNTNLTLSDLTAIHGHDKNIIVRYTTGAIITNINCDSASWEDGLMLYGNDINIDVDSVVVSNCPRYGFGWNGIYSANLTANNISSSGCRFGVAVNAKTAVLNNLNIQDCLFLANTYGVYNVTFNDININNATGQEAGNILYMCGNLKNIVFNNLTFNDCDGTAIKILDVYGGSPILPPENITINGGGIYDHLGVEWDVVAGTDIDTIDFEMLRPDTSFIPYDVNNKFIFESDSGITTINDSVSSWIDRIGDYNITQDTTYKRPEYRDSCLYFDGSNDNLVYSSPATVFNLGSNDLTISGEFNIPNATPQSFIFAKYYSGGNSYYLSVFSNDLRFFATTSSVTRIFVYSNQSQQLIQNNTKYIFTISLDRDGIGKIYLNGYEYSTVTNTMSNTAISISSAFCIGSELYYLVYSNINISWLQIDNTLRDKQWAYDFWNYLK